MKSRRSKLLDQWEKNLKTQERDIKEKIKQHSNLIAATIKYENRIKALEKEIKLLKRNTEPTNHSQHTTSQRTTEPTQTTIPIAIPTLSENLLARIFERVIRTDERTKSTQPTEERIIVDYNHAHPTNNLPYDSACSHTTPRTWPHTEHTDTHQHTKGPVGTTTLTTISTGEDPIGTTTTLIPTGEDPTNSSHLWQKDIPNTSQTTSTKGMLIETAPQNAVAPITRRASNHSPKTVKRKNT